MSKNKTAEYQSPSYFQTDTLTESEQIKMKEKIRHVESFSLLNLEEVLNGIKAGGKGGLYNIDIQLRSDAVKALALKLTNGENFKLPTDNEAPENLIICATPSEFSNKDTKAMYLEAAIAHIKLNKKPVHFIITGEAHHTLISIIPNHKDPKRLDIVYCNSIDEAYIEELAVQEITRQETERLRNNMTARSKSDLEEAIKEAKKELLKGKLYNLGISEAVNIERFLKIYLPQNYFITSHVARKQQQLGNNCGVAVACNIAHINEIHDRDVETRTNQLFNWDEFQNINNNIIDLRNQSAVEDFVINQFNSLRKYQQVPKPQIHTPQLSSKPDIQDTHTKKPLSPKQNIVNSIRNTNESATRPKYIKPRVKDQIRAEWLTNQPENVNFEEARQEFLALLDQEKNKDKNQGYDHNVNSQGKNKSRSSLTQSAFESSQSTITPSVNTGTSLNTSPHNAKPQKKPASSELNRALNTASPVEQDNIQKPTDSAQPPMYAHQESKRSSLPRIIGYAVAAVAFMNVGLFGLVIGYMAFKVLDKLINEKSTSLEIF